MSAMVILLSRAPEGLPRVWALGLAALVFPFLAIPLGRAVGLLQVPFTASQREHPWYRDANPVLRITFAVLARLLVYAVFALATWALLQWLG